MKNQNVTRSILHANIDIKDSPDPKPQPVVSLVAEPVPEPETDPSKPETDNIQLMALADLTTEEPFCDLFPIEDETLNSISERMKSAGYDKGYPILVWEGTVVDGHTRLKAAKQAGLEKVWVLHKSFQDENEALEYAVMNQRDRRKKLKDSVILRLVEKLDRQRDKGGDRRSQEAVSILMNKRIDPKPETSEITAKLIGIGKPKVHDARRILKHKDPKIKQEVLDDRTSIIRAAKAIGGNSKTAMKEKIHGLLKIKDSVGWTAYVWDPIVQTEEGEFRLLDDRIQALFQTDIPAGSTGIDKTVLISSQFNLFQEGIDPMWITDILGMIKHLKQFTFLILTNKPGRLAEIEWPANTWVGVEVRDQDSIGPAEEAFENVKAEHKFVFCCPQSEKLSFQNLKKIDWLVIGEGEDKGLVNPTQPKWEVVSDLVNQARAAEVPGGGPR